MQRLTAKKRNFNGTGLRNGWEMGLSMEFVHFRIPVFDGFFPMKEMAMFHGYVRLAEGI